MKEVIVQLAPKAAAASEGSPHQTARNFGTTLEATHPNSHDPDLSRWFHAKVDNARAAEFLETLRNIPEVTAAYVKPPAESP